MKRCVYLQVLYKYAYMYIAQHNGFNIAGAVIILAWHILLVLGLNGLIDCMIHSQKLILFVAFMRSRVSINCLNSVLYHFMKMYEHMS